MSSQFNPPEDEFTLDPDLIFDQASDVEEIRFAHSDGTDRLYLVFARKAMVEAPDGVDCDEDGKCLGCEIVAYACEEKGHVTDWERRYEMQGVNVNATVNRLRYRLVNGLACLCNYEGSLADINDLYPADLYQ